MSAQRELIGRRALVTGAAQGIGRAIAERLHTAGATVVVVDLDEARLREVWADFDERIAAQRCDVSSSAEVDALISRTTDEGGPVEILVNNAGITRDAMTWKMTDDQWRSVLDVHLSGTFFVSRAAIPGMRAGSWGRIVNLTSFTGMHGNIGQANYAAAKGGIIGLTKTMAKEVAAFGITVNAVSPNAETPMVAAVPPAKRSELEAMIPMRRFGSPGEIADAVAFLCSEEAAYITGAVLPVDGGMSM